MIELEFELCCKNCGELFTSTNENLIYCPTCWRAYLESHKKNQVPIRLTQEYIDSIVSEMNE